MSGHVEEVQVGLFCALRAEPCNCPTNAPYITNALAKATGWATFSFPQRLKLDTGTISFPKKAEAHHILCTASIREFLIGDAKINPIVAGCKWCINEKVNMIPMPLWGHTIKWYHTFDDVTKTVTAVAGAAPPPFANIPQHNIGHNGPGRYLDEIHDKVRAVAATVKANLEAHKVNPQMIAGDLNTLSGDWDIVLTARGIRQGGTHIAWTNGATMSQWYEPFSMASTAFITKTPYPKAFTDKTNQMIEKLKKAMWG